MIATLELEKLVRQITDDVVAILEKTYHPMYSSDGGNEHLHSEHADMLLQLGASRIGARPGIKNMPGNLAPLIDHTLLKPDALPDQVEALCKEALQYGFASVCINSCYVKYAYSLLKSSRVKVCTVVGFPLGASITGAKVYEAQLAEADGAEEIDMVLPIGALKSKGYEYVQNDIASVVKNVSPRTIVKVILETALLTDEEKIMACELAKKAGAHFVKTSTGFVPGGATPGDIALMRQVVGPNMGVKASGGIRDRKAAELMVKAGATRIGASASVKIVTEDENAKSTPGDAGKY